MTDDGLIEKTYTNAHALDIGYDDAGRRAFTLTAFKELTPIFQQPFLNGRRETYKYYTGSVAGTGLLSEVWANAGTQAQPEPSGDGVKRASFNYDVTGRQLNQVDYDASGAWVFQRVIDWSDKSQIETDETWTIRGGTIYHALSIYDYGTIEAGTYALGAALSITTQNWRGESPKPTKIANEYQWWDGAVQRNTTYDSDAGDPGNLTTSSFYTYWNVGGSQQLMKADANDGGNATWFSSTTGHDKSSLAPGQQYIRCEVLTFGSDRRARRMSGGRGLAMRVWRSG